MQLEEDEVSLSGMSRSDWRMCPLQTFFFTQLQLRYTVPTPTVGEAHSFSFLPPLGAVVLSAALQIPNDGDF